MLHGTPHNMHTLNAYKSTHTQTQCKGCNILYTKHVNYTDEHARTLHSMVLSTSHLICIRMSLFWSSKTTLQTNICTDCTAVPLDTHREERWSK